MPPDAFQACSLLQAHCEPRRSKKTAATATLRAFYELNTTAKFVLQFLATSLLNGNLHLCNLLLHLLDASSSSLINLIFSCHTFSVPARHRATFRSGWPRFYNRPRPRMTASSAPHRTLSCPIHHVERRERTEEGEEGEEERRSSIPGKGESKPTRRTDESLELIRKLQRVSSSSFAHVRAGP